MSDKLNQLIELLKLEKIDDLIFRGASEDLGFRQVFGGQVVAQSLCCRDASCTTGARTSFLPCLLFSVRATANTRLFTMWKPYVKVATSLHYA